MKRNDNTLLQLSTLVILSTLSFTNLSFAEKIYTWKDESGKTHFTNNPALVPLKKDADIIKMKALPAAPKPKAKLDGEALWVKNCQQCHVLSATGMNNLRGMRKLIDAINDPSTTPSLDIMILQAAIDDDMDDLATITLTDDEVQAVAAYIRKKVLHKANAPKKEGSQAAP